MCVVGKKVKLELLGVLEENCHFLGDASGVLLVPVLHQQGRDVRDIMLPDQKFNIVMRSGDFTELKVDRPATE